MAMARNADYEEWRKCSKDFWQALSEFYFENGDLERQCDASKGF